MLRYKMTKNADGGVQLQRKPDVQANIKALQDKYDEVKDHCMCLAIHDDGAYYRVIYPAGDWPDGVEGVQAGYLITGKLTALTRMLDRMERDWLGSFPGRS